jgi:hypothetical protein
MSLHKHPNSTRNSPQDVTGDASEARVHDGGESQMVETAIDSTSPTEPVVVEYDLPCRTCGYNLRGLSPRGVCPECQTPVDRALHGDLLRYSDPRWVRSLARGMRMLNAAVALTLILVITMMVLQPLRERVWLMMSLALGLGALAVAGVWLATQRDPAAIEREPALSWRRTLRIAMIVAVTLEAFDDLLINSLAGVRPARTSMMLLGTLAWIVVIIAALQHAAALARRIPHRDLVSQTRGVMWGLILSYGGASVIIALIYSHAQLPEALTVVFGLSCTIVVACIMFTLWTLALVSRHAQALSAAASEAELTWVHSQARLEAGASAAGHGASGSR